MTKYGYQTSSEYVEELIDQDGLDSFRVLCIRHFATPKEVTEYEKKFLTKIDARNHPRYINKSNGHGEPLSEETKKNIRDAHQNRSSEEKAEIAQKQSDAMNNKSPEEKAEIAQKKRDAMNNKSSEEKAERIKKILETKNNKSPEEKAEHAQKQRDANKGLRLYDKPGEKSRKFKKQPEDTTWVLRLTKKELKDLGYPLYHHPSKQSKRFQYPPKDSAWVCRDFI